MGEERKSTAYTELMIHKVNRPYIEFGIDVLTCIYFII